MFSLGLAIGANTAIYSIVDAALLRPLPVPQPDRLFTLATPSRPATEFRHPGSDTFSYPLYEQLRAAAGDSARLALFDSPNRVEAQACGADAPYEEVIQQVVSPDAFDVLGVPPALGRLFSPAEDHYPVAARGGGAELRLLAAPVRGGSAASWGRVSSLSGRTYSILGVAREGFSGAGAGQVRGRLAAGHAGRSRHLHQPRYPAVPPRWAAWRRASSRKQLAARLQPAFHRHQETENRLRGRTCLRPLQKQLRETILFGGLRSERDLRFPADILAAVVDSAGRFRCASC